MNTITKTITKVFGMLMLLTVTNIQAQWTTLKAHIQESDISKLTGQSHHNYKGLSAAPFEIVASVEVVKDKGQVKLMLRTQSINMSKYYMYSYQPALKVKRCTYGKLEEFDRTNGFSPSEIGDAPFETAMRTAIATFDIEVTATVKDEKYGISGFGNKKGWGYQVIRVFKNVKANDVVWAEEPIETTFPVEDIKLINPKPVSFKINDSGIQTAVLDFVAKQNQEAETRCKEIAKENEADKKKKDEEAAKIEANAKEIAKMKEKLGGTINVTSNKAKTDDFWSGGTDKSTASKSKEDDFWSGGEEKTKVAATKPSNSKGVKGYEREEVWESIKMDKNGNEVRWGDYVRFKSNGEWKTEQILNHNNYSSKFIGQYNVIMDPNTTSILLPCSGDVDLKVTTSIFSIINRKGEVVMTSNLGDGFGVLGNTHFIINYFGFDRNYRGCSANIIDVRTQKEILKLPTNYYNPNKYTSIRSGFSHSNYFIDSDGVYSGHVNPKMSIFLENVQKEIVSGNFVGCLVYEEDAYKSMINNSITYVNLIFLRDDGSYVEKKGVKMLND